MNPEATNGHERKTLGFFFIHILKELKQVEMHKNSLFRTLLLGKGKLSPSSTLLQYFDITPSKKICNIFSSTLFQVTQAIVGKP